ncbi:MAG: substrate-binding domain-containing protein [Cyanobacteria bacterium P01_C01_bin.147]
MSAEKILDNEATLRLKGWAVTVVNPKNKKRLFGLPRLRPGGKRSGRQANLAKTVRQRELSRVQGRFSFFRSQLLYRVYSVVPSRYRWMLPMLRDFVPGVADDEAEAIDGAIATDDDAVIPAITDDFLLPALAPGTELLGQRGRYRIEALVSVRGRGRVYQGRQLGNEQPVSVREYLLPRRQFTPSEIRLRQNSFRDRGGLALADGRPERFRLMQPEEAIPDQKEPRCYLIDTEEIDLLPSLRTHLQARSPWSAPLVWRFYNQVLQTLESLHGQKFTVPAGQVRQRIVHGNLSLDSILIDWPEDPAFAGDPQFLVYLTDLLLWEGLFDLPGQETPRPTVADDLAAVGRLGYRLLVGEPDDAAIGDPRQPADWPAVQPALKQYTFQLLGLRTPFLSAAAARQAIPADWQLLETSSLAVTADEAEAAPARRWWRWLLALLLLGLLGGALGWWLTRRQRAIASSETPQLCCFDGATGVPRGAFTYASDRAGLGDYVFRQKNLVFSDVTVEAAIETTYPEVALTYSPMLTDEAAIAAVINEEADFALSAVFGESAGALQPIPAELQASPVAHDAIAVYVAFSYEQRAQGLPQALNGRLTFDQLRQLYTGQITNWRQLGGPDLPVQLYVPSEPDMVAIFEARVLQDPLTIAAFRQLVELQTIQSSPITPTDGPPITPVRVLRTFDSLRAVIQDFEEAAIGSIGFGPLSQVFGQCSVYPLALQADTGPFVQAIVRTEGGTAIDPAIDLCQDKGSYQRDDRLIVTGQYPLAYPFEVIYPYDNSRPPMGRKVVEMLQATDSQRQLERAGLVPIEIAED